MTDTLDSLRKAAILLASLDADTAAGLLEQMPPELARAARELMTQLEDVDPAEQQVVIDEFLRSGQAEEAGSDGVEIEAGLAEQLDLQTRVYHADPADQPTTEKASEDDPPTPSTEPFGFLQESSSDEIMEHLEDEHPQTIAVIVSHLSPSRAAEVLARLDDALQADVVRRLVHLGQADPDMVREVEQGLLTLMVDEPYQANRSRRGTGAVASILQAAGSEARQAILENLAEHEPRLAARFTPPQAAEAAVGSLSFEDLEHLSDLALAKIFGDTPPDVLTLALAGAHPSFVRRVLSQLPRREARQLRRTLEQLGPTRLADVEHAQHELVEVARRLDAAGRIELPGRRTISLTI